MNHRGTEITESIIGSAIEVHKHLGPGLLESVYEAALAYELNSRGVEFERQKVLDIRYKDIVLPEALRMDFVVGGQVVVELKCADSLLPIHEAQLLSYLKLSGMKVGLLINFKVPVLVQGVKRISN